MIGVDQENVDKNARVTALSFGWVSVKLNGLTISG